MSGRPICDIKILARELNVKSRTYDLQSLCTTVGIENIFMLL